MYRAVIIILALVLLGCAKLSVETKKPIQVDINMRVDVYQHVVNDVESINDQLYGPGDQGFNILFGMQAAYASDLSEEANQAIARRKERLAKVEEYFAKGYVGENSRALLEIKGSVPGEIKGQVQDTVNKENSDREIIYKAIADKNNSSLSTVREVSRNSDYNRAPSGYLFEVYDASQEKFIWKKK
ncbi:MAG: DUF1318 domain-containing protein [Candidatus Omnitrophica bacterium]|nr:DUF1318 domain-containing protein [Candidatus Omnitrophota bacterium]